MGNLKARNASTTLGLLWWVLNPLLLGAVYWLVFGVLFDRGTLDDGMPFLEGHLNRFGCQLEIRHGKR